MKTSTPTKILTTHVGSLPRSKEVADLLFTKEEGKPVDEQIFYQTIQKAVETVVVKQQQTGIDIISDGEMSKISYATYIKDRISGFEGDSPRNPPADLEKFPNFLKKAAKSGGTPTYSKPCCTSAVHPKDKIPLEKDLQHLQKALSKNSHCEEVFMNAASPGVIGMFLPNKYYQNQNDYLMALAEAMRPEYEAIVNAGFILQVDCPDIGLGKHMMYKDKSLETYLESAYQHMEALNQALINISPDKVRMHVCYGNYEGPHHYDLPIDQVLPITFRANTRAILFEHCNPRHAHEWALIRDMEVPEDKILIPGVIDSTTNYIEHPELVAQRIKNFTNTFGNERIIAGTDCGFSTFAGFGKVDEDIVYAKLASLVSGANIASQH